jgi:DnaJ-class molecular chaperone
VKLISIARAVQPFINKDATLEAIYKEICSNKALPFKDILKPIDLVKLVFISKCISKGEDPKELLQEMEGNLFLFNIVEFGENNQEESCDVCYGDGSINCGNCDGSGDYTCDECDGYGEDDEGDTCVECQGGGEVECGDCGGMGTSECSSCDGSGYISTTDYVPYDILQYVSYDLPLKIQIEQQILRNNIGRIRFKSNKTFLLYVDEVGIKDGETDSIDAKYESESFYLNVPEDNIEDLLIWSGNKILSSDNGATELSKFYE